MYIQGWFPLGLTGLFLQSKGLSRVFSSTTIQKHHFLGAQPSLWSNSHPSMTTRKNIVLTIWTFVGKVMSLLFNTLSEFVIAFHPKSKHLLILWLKSLSIVIVETKKIKSVQCFYFSPICLPWRHGTWCHDLSFLMLSFKPAFSLSSFTFKRLFSSSLLSAIRVVSYAYLTLLIFLRILNQAGNLDSSLGSIQSGI